VLIFTGDIAFIANVTNFTLFITFIVINASVIALRYHSPDATRAFRVPGSVCRLPVLRSRGSSSVFSSSLRRNGRFSYSVQGSRALASYSC
jgi:amino acid transporter